MNTYTNLVEATRNEVLRLIDNQSELLDGLLNIPNLLIEVNEDKQQGIDSKKVKNWQSVLNNEKKKVENLEMVLAVVGIMKAGKSTTINAISGSEILPNRNQPMTTLPTLIRHCKGKKVPVLSFMKHQPLEGMVNNIKNKLKKLKQSNTLNLISLSKEKNGQELINRIINNYDEFSKERYEGQKQIFEFLQKLNDLVRLAQDPYIDVEFPIEQYEDLNDLPFIEVEFTHLTNLKEVDKGSIALLDTPGPNEYGQGKRLRKILDAQIARASAVLMIVDYNNLKSEAEGEIRDRLEEQTGLISDRLFTIVNKFDQKNTNSMNEDEVKQYVADTLMQGKISQERVYPASARNGYLANRARQEMDRNGHLPDDDWVDDFGKVAFGDAWGVFKSSGDQNTELIKSMIPTVIPTVWKNSMFEKPLKEAIIKASETSALVSMQSATAKMLDFGNRLENFLEISRGSLTKNIQEIRDIVHQLENDVNKIEEAEKKAEQELRKQLAVFFEVIKKIHSNIQKELGETLDSYFEYGKLVEGYDYQQKVKEEKSREEYRKKWEQSLPSFLYLSSTQKIIQLIFQNKYELTRRPVFEFDASSSKVTFASEEEAKKFVEKINREINSLAITAEQNLEKVIKEISDSLEQEIPNILVDNIGEILREAEQKLGRAGLTITFRIPEPNPERNKINFSLLVLASVEGKETKTPTTEIKETEGFFKGQVLRGAGEAIKWGTLWFLRPKWGYEEIEIEKTESAYVVDIRNLRQNILEELGNKIVDLERSNQEFFESGVKPVIDDYFDGIKNYLKEFRDSVIDTINKRRLDEKSTQKLIQEIIDMKKNIGFHYKDVQGINRGLRELK
ncbi:MAG: dynamin family protein [Rivularia sp. (in: cyanobacteria)]